MSDCQQLADQVVFQGYPRRGFVRQMLQDLYGIGRNYEGLLYRVGLFKGLVRQPETIGSGDLQDITQVNGDSS